MFVRALAGWLARARAKLRAAQKAPAGKTPMHTVQWAINFNLNILGWQVVIIHPESIIRNVNANADSEPAALGWRRRPGLE